VGPSAVNASSPVAARIGYIYDLLTHDNAFQQALALRVPGENVTFYLVLFKKRDLELTGTKQRFSLFYYFFGVAWIFSPFWY
jgi:hypothetical protein